MKLMRKKSCSMIIEKTPESYGTLIWVSEKISQEGSDRIEKNKERTKEKK
jgi:hypothetical protein